jgi:hypothetical protein
VQHHAIVIFSRVKASSTAIAHPPPADRDHRLLWLTWSPRTFSSVPGCGKKPKAENVRVNGDMVRNLFAALERKPLVHTALVTGTKHYLVHRLISSWHMVAFKMGRRQGVRRAHI